MDELPKTEKIEDRISESIKVQPVGTTVLPTKDKRRHYLAAFFLSFLWGTFGIDRFYLGKIFTGILKLITFGGFGLWTIIDLVLIMSGSMHDKQGNELIDVKRYKKFAGITISIFAVLMGLVMLLSGLALISGVNQLMQSDIFQKYINSGGSVQQILEGGSINLDGINFDQILNGSFDMESLQEQVQNYQK